MKGRNYFPFERNQYFYGKLLSVDDFETEQHYINKKRRLGNHFLHGTGVVCGLKTVQVDDQTISIDAGIALDGAGREVIVERPLVKRLADLDGFQQCMEDKSDSYSCFLCLEYEEHGKEPAYNVMGSAYERRESDFNKIAEGYHLYLTTERPAQALNPFERYYEERALLYSRGSVKVWQVFPRYIESGQEFEWKLIVENYGSAYLNLSYRLNLQNIRYKDTECINVTFDEGVYEKTGYYEATYRMTAASIPSGSASAVLERQSFQVSLGLQRLSSDSVSHAVSMKIYSDNSVEDIIDCYFRDAMEQNVQGTPLQPIYLAEMSVIRAETTYLIDHLQPIPFGQLVQSTHLTTLVTEILMRRVEKLQKQVRELNNQNRQTSVTKRDGLANASQQTAVDIRTGTIVLNLGIGGKAGQKFFSKKLAHGLGLGDVTIILGRAVDADSSAQMLFGERGVFENDAVNEVNADISALTNIEEGTFQIGMRLQETTVVHAVKIHWTAIKNRQEQQTEAVVRKLTLKPEMVYLKQRGSCQFETVFTGMEAQEMRYHVREPQGGRIDENGLYIAPNVAGVYEISAESVVDPKLKAQAFVAVRAEE